jgi:flagella basal body P-ring formation protein FlgA
MVCIAERAMILPKAWALCWLGLGCAGSALAQQDDGQARAEQALQQVLAQRHPGVAQWHITALADSRQLQRLAERSVTQVAVVHTGKRSAVRLCDSAPKQSCATLWFAVSGLQAVLSSERELAQSHTVAAADFTLQRHDVMNLRCTLLVSLDGLEGLRTTRPLAAGAVLCRQFLEPRPTVSRGETVEVRAAAGAALITARAVAQQDASLGQSVHIKRSHSAAPILATVTGAGQVSIGQVSIGQVSVGQVPVSNPNE